MRLSNELLESFANLTAMKDREVLEVGLLILLSAHSQAAEVRYWRCISRQDEPCLLPLATLVGDNIDYLDPLHAQADAATPLRQQAHWRHCAEQRQVQAWCELDENYLLLPVFSDERLLGLVQLRQPQPFADDAKRSIGLLLRLYCNHMTLLDYSEHDTLTGLANRRTFDADFHKILLEQRRPHSVGNRQGRRENEARGHWLAVVDIDWFKRINDRFGHLYGDEVLVLLAQLMRRAFRNQDKLYRFGGEEFVILLAAGCAEQAAIALERFRRNVAEFAFQQVGQVTVSIGCTRIASLDIGSEVLGRADQALYYAKQNGRNQLAHHETLAKTASPARHGDVEFS